MPPSFFLSVSINPPTCSLFFFSITVLSVHTLGLQIHNSLVSVLFTFLCPESRPSPLFRFLVPSNTSPYTPPIFSIAHISCQSLIISPSNLLLFAHSLHLTGSGSMKVSPKILRPKDFLSPGSVKFVLFRYQSGLINISLIYL